MNYKFLEKIEFNKILDTLSSFCETEIGKDYAINLIPSFSFNEVKNNLEETSEAFSYLNLLDTFPYIYTKKINLCVKKLNSNNYLNTLDLLTIANILKSSRGIKESFNKLNVEFKVLQKYYSQLYSNFNLEENILSKIIDENTIDDHASEKLYSIRNKKRNIEKQIKESLNNFIHSSKYVQEPVITIRNDRYVIPIKDEYRSNVKGFLHDISKAGSTVFIEPNFIFELNNELNHISSEEKLEIENILKNLSSFVFPVINEIEKTSSIIGNIDFILAKAQYAKHLKANKPILTNKKYFSFVKACHPLISIEKVVPIDLYLGNSFTSLIITGPNTGGKTVTLKTCAILLAMAYSGLYITASEKTEICVFDNIFIDVGDEQSIENSLSTFSAHITNIVTIIKNATSNSLVLIDELGSGTDPLEGSSLAISILEYFNKKNILTIATTHYPEIKNYCLQTENFENACVEFDTQTLKPTYRLLIGIPGKSNAFEISQKLGIPNNIIEKAKTFLNEDTENVEELLKNIYDNKSFIEKEKLNIEKKLLEVENLKESLEKEKEKIEIKKAKLIEDAKYEARQILTNAKSQVSTAIKEIDSASNKTLNTIRNELNNSIKNTYENKKQTNKKINNLDINTIKKGDTVFVNSLNQNGILLSTPSKSKKVQVQVGLTKLNVNFSDLSSALQNTNKKISTSTKINLKQNKVFSTEINVIGFNVEEAIFVIDKFLDDCVLYNLKEVRIIHGKGTGTLKNGIHNFLKKHPHVESYRLGTFGEGEMGVTVVKIK